MDFLLGLIIFVIKFILPFVLLVLIAFLIWKFIGNLLSALADKLIVVLRKILTLLRFVFSLEGISYLFKSLIDVIGHSINKMLTKLTNLFINVAKESFSRVYTRIMKLVKSIFRMLIFRRYVTAKRRTKTLFRANISDANRAAKERLHFLKEKLGESTFYTFEQILELPPGLDETVICSEELSPQDAIAQMVRLRWQLQEDLYLIFGRLQDTLVALLRREGYMPITVDKKFIENNIFDISLRRLPHNEISSEIFPWTIIVGTNKPKFITDKLMSLREWIGIGIEIAKPLRVKRLGFCKHSPDVVGEVAGLLMQTVDDRNEQDSVIKTKIFALTCKHVIPYCDCDVAHGSLDRGSQPDAALLPLYGNCFTSDNFKTVPIDTATRAQIKDFSVREIRVRRLGGDSKIYFGLIENPLTSFACDGVLSEFPAFSVVLDKKYFLGLIPYPLFRKTFSKPGDSGAWVLSEERDKWLGMVFVGSTRARLTYVLIGEALLSHFKLDLIRLSSNKIINKLRPLYLEKGN